MALQIDPEARFIKGSGLASRKILNEILLVPIRTGPKQKLGVYTLNETAAWLFEMLDESRSLSDLVEAVKRRFEVKPDRAKRDVAALCRDLLSIGAIVPADSPKGTGA